jgi:DMSO/TMAO reductase YedYZ molybdopterin-dependent catalytic subunit
MSKRILLLSLLLVAMLAACGQAEPAADTAVSALTVRSGEVSQTYTREDLAALDEATATWEDVTYVGVPLATLLADAGVDLENTRAVKATAGDGFSANYEMEMATRPDTLVAYAREGGELSEEERPFRMVIPGERGRLNVRMLSEIEAIQ